MRPAPKGTGAVLLSAAAILSLLPAQPAIAAARPVAGKATHYQLTSGGGNCSYPRPPASGLYVALSPAEYAKGAACGSYLKVTGPSGSVRVQVVDQCPECPAGHVDLSRTAFARIADPARGMVNVTYTRVRDPRPTRPLAFRVKEGSSRWWLAVLVGGHGNRLTSVEVRAPGGGWRRLARADYNYWIAEQGMGPGPFTIRVRDDRRHRATVSGVRLKPGVVQRSTTRLYR